MTTTSPFTGFGPGLYEFFEGLTANNDRSWFTEHRADYLAEVKAPLEALLAELDGRFGRAKLFRIDRDVRFSADKSPYKTVQAGMIDRGPRGTLYVQVSAEGAMIGAGAPHFDAGQLARWREAVAGEPGEELTAIIGRLARSSIDVGTLGDDGVTMTGDLKRVPPPYPRDHPRADLLRLKRVVAVRTWDRPDWLERRAAVERVAGTWDRMDPLADWLAAHVGPSDGTGRGFRR